MPSLPWTLPLLLLVLFIHFEQILPSNCTRAVYDNAVTCFLSLRARDRAGVDGVGEDDRDEAECEVYGCDDAHEDEVAAFADRYAWWD